LARYEGVGELVNNDIVAKSAAGRAYAPNLGNRGKSRTSDQQLSGSRSVDRKVTGFSGMRYTTLNTVALPTEPRRLGRESPQVPILTLLFGVRIITKGAYINTILDEIAQNQGGMSLYTTIDNNSIIETRNTRLIFSEEMNMSERENIRKKTGVC